jgi:hypothetical protein
MPQPIKIEASVEGPLFQTLGSFWTSVFKESDKVRIMLEAAMQNTLLGDFNRVLQDMTGEAKLGALLRYITVPFAQADIIETGTQTYGDAARDRQFGSDISYMSTYGGAEMRYWALPLQNVVPLSILSDTKLMLLGTDFFIQADRYIYFRQDPRTIFPAGSYTVVKGFATNHRPWISFFTQTVAPGYDDIVVNYMRHNQTPEMLRLVLSVVGGLSLIRRGGELRQIIESKTNVKEVTYVFDDEAVRVAYPHTRLILGHAYTPNTVVGDAVKVIQADGSNRSWWREIDWRGGMVLDPIIPEFKDLPLPDRWVVAYNAGQDAGSVDGSKVHARLRLSDNYDAESAYWAAVAARETSTGFYLNRILGLDNEAEGTFASFMEQHAANVELQTRMNWTVEQPQLASLPGGKQVNALDVFFESVLRTVGMVIALDLAGLPKQKELFDFLTRERPAGGCPVIIGFAPPVIDQYDRFDTDILVGESVATNEFLLVSTTDEVDGTIFEHESAIIKHLYQS